MAKYGHEVKEEAYVLWYIQQLPFTTVLKKMREKYPHLAKNTLTNWRKDTNLAWDIRYDEYCRTLQQIADEERVKEMVPIVTAIEDIRDKVYNKLVTFLNAAEGTAVITDKNFGFVLSSFAKLGELENKMKGKGSPATPVKQVINVVIMALEKNPNVGPLIKAHKHEIEEAIIEQIKAQ